ncbi:MAG: undecaprenyldiphospho-muramoylpentapeptide beta-N-acetylglucosaminyltransferase, partial [Alphaproteobacteria bacterium]|nr:undecaprenyldiphospho-muramoylpentapeptide beta-N-acetylglucosaminyltransferase [Alphaproteobacteria bacterium]
MRSYNINKKLIVLTAGGTGGHVYPSEALAGELMCRGYDLLLITDKRGKNNYKGHLGEIPNFDVFSGGIVGKSILFKMKSLLKLSLGVMQAMWILWRNKPLCVVGFGGYASFPACVAAILSGTPLVIHEQNSVMSRTNRFLSKYATLIAQSFKRVKYASDEQKNILCGMPVRASIVEAASREYPQLEKGDVLQILVLGGSQGAKILADVVPQAIREAKKNISNKIKVIQQCREGEEKQIEAAYEGSEIEVVVKHFFDNMNELYAASHIVISRSGASSVSEIAVVGVPSILIPLPTAADDHQTSNAEEIAEVNAGIVIAQKDLNSQNLAKIISDWGNDYVKLKRMSDFA